MTSPVTYQPGDRIALVATGDPCTRLRPGDTGTVTRWDPAQGQLHIRWDSGSSLSMLLDGGRPCPPDHPRLRGSREGARPVSASSPQPAALDAALRQAWDLGRRHGRAAVYWQIGDSDSGWAFYRELLDGIASADPAITGLYAVPDLTARWDYDRENLAADLGLADGDPGLDQAAEAFLGAAREEFWLEAARLARRRLAPGAADEAGDGTEPEESGDPDDGEAAPDWRQDISDPATELSRLLSERCGTCILRPGDPMHLGPERTAAFIRQVLAERSYVV